MKADSFIVYIKKMILIKTFQNMLNLDLILQLMNQINCHQNKKRKRVNGSMKDESG